MLLPSGTPLYQGLDTAFTNLRELLRSLKESKFYGYVEVRFPKYQAVLLCDAGDVVAASEDASGQLRGGQEAIAGLLARAAERGGEVSVVELSADLVYRWATCANSQPVHRDLSTEFARLDKLLADLRRQLHSGHVELLYRSGGTALVFLDEGQLTQCLFSDPNGTISDRPALQRILEEAERAGATIGVYRATGTPAPRIDRAALGDAAARAGHDPFGALEELLRKLEVAVDAVAGGGALGLALRRALQGRSEQYPFLDPFEGLFDFRDGRVTFRGAEEPRVVIPAVWECLVQALDGLARDPVLAARGLRGRLQAVARAQARDLPAEWRGWGIDVNLLGSGG